MHQYKCSMCMECLSCTVAVCEFVLQFPFEAVLPPAPLGGVVDHSFFRMLRLLRLFRVSRVTKMCVINYSCFFFFLNLALMCLTLDGFTSETPLTG